MLTINFKQIYETNERVDKEWVLIIYDISANHYVGMPVYSKEKEGCIYCNSINKYVDVNKIADYNRSKMNRCIYVHGKPLKLTKKDLNDLLITLPLSKQKIQLKYPSLSEMIIMGEKLRDYFTKFPNADRRETLYTTSAMLYIDKVNDEHLISEELEDYVDKMDIIDNRYFRKAITTIDSKFGLSESIATQCPTCHKEFTHGLPITGELFNPSL